MGVYRRGRGCALASNAGHWGLVWVRVRVRVRVGVRVRVRVRARVRVRVRVSLDEEDVLLGSTRLDLRRAHLARYRRDMGEI